MPSNESNPHSCSQEMFLIAPKHSVRGPRFFNVYFFIQLVLRCKLKKQARSNLFQKLYFSVNLILKRIS